MLIKLLSASVQLNYESLQYQVGLSPAAHRLSQCGQAVQYFLIVEFHLFSNTQLLIIFTSRTFRPKGPCQLLTCKQFISAVYCSARKFHNYEPLQHDTPLCPLSPLLSLSINLFHFVLRFYTLYFLSSILIFLHSPPFHQALKARPNCLHRLFTPMKQKLKDLRLKV